jgi:hypothetical protein
MMKFHLEKIKKFGQRFQKLNNDENSENGDQTPQELASKYNFGQLK